MGLKNKNWLMIAFLFLINFGCTKKESTSSLEIVLPEGEQIKYSTSAFSLYSKNDFQVFLREVVDNKTLATKAEITPSQSELSKEADQYSYLIPRGSSIEGFLVLQIIMNKYSSLPLTAFIFSREEVIEPSLESTLLYQLVSQYPDKDIHSFTKSQLQTLYQFIKAFSAQRRDLFGIKPETNPKGIYNFLKNGLSINVEFLTLAQSMDLKFNFDTEGNILAKPYPFGTPNNPPILDESRSTPPGALSAYESIRLDVRASALDGDNDILFVYWIYEGNIVLKDESKWQTLYDFDSSNEIDKKNNPPFYKLQAVISDGGRDLIAEWQIYVSDNNRPPALSYDCPTLIHEGETFECVFKGVDLDKDLLRFNGLSLSYFNARPTMNGIPWPGPTDFVDEMIFKWTPKNRNFSAAMANTILSLVGDDGKSGKISAVLNLSMVDKNSPPYPYVDPNGKTLRQIDDGEGPPRTLQTLSPLFIDPVTKKIGTADTAKKFYFELLVVDDDNMNLADVADFDDIPQPLSGSSEFQAVTIEPYPNLPANSIVHIFPPADSPPLTGIHAEHNPLMPSSVVDAIANNPFFQVTFIRDVESSTKTIIPKGTRLNLKNEDVTDEYTYVLPVDVVLPNGGPATRISTKADHVMNLIPQIRSYNIPALDPEAKKEFVELTINGVKKIVKRFVYSWMPLILSPTVTANFLPKDDHGGKGAAFRFQQTATIYSQLPECGTGFPSSFSTTNQVVQITGAVTCTDMDNTQGPTYLDLTTSPPSSGDPNSNIYKVLPFLKRSNSSAGINPLIFKSDLFNGSSNFRYLSPFSATTDPLSLVQLHFAHSAGVLMFSRPSCSLGTPSASLPSAGAAITIPAGTLFRTNYNGAVGPSYVPRITFATLAEVTLAPWECSAIVPIIPHITSRTLAANGLQIIEPPVGAPALSGISLSHGALSAATNLDAYTNTPSLDVKFTRTVASATATPILAGTGVRSNEAGGAESFVYFVPVPTVLPAGAIGTNVTIRVVRDFKAGMGTTLSRPLSYYESTGDSLLTSTITPNKMSWVGVPIPGVQLNQPAVVMPHTSYSLQILNKINTVKMNYKFLDGNIPTVNEFVSLSTLGLDSGVEPSPAKAFRSDPQFINLKIRNPAFSHPLYGVVEIYRSQTGPNITIPQNLILSTPDRKLFKVYRDEVLSTTNTVFVFVERFFEADFQPKAGSFNLNWQHFNFGLNITQFINSNGSANVFPSVPYEFPIEVGDNTTAAPGGPMVPQNPWDRYFIVGGASGTGINYTTDVRPLGPLQLCRQLSAINPICSPCTAATDPSMSNNESRYCYLRFTADPADAAKILDFNISISESGPVPTLAPTLRSGRIQVNETNNPPQMTDAGFNPLASCTRNYPNASNNYITHLFNAAVLPSTTVAAPPADFDTACAFPLITEGSTSTVPLFAFDGDKDSFNNLINRFELSDKIWDLKTKALLPRPASMALTGFNGNVAPIPAIGKKATVNMVWNPTDDDAKKLTTAEGFIIGIRAVDSSKVDSPKSAIAYYKVVLKNINSPPSMGPITLQPSMTTPSVFQIFVNTYFKATVDIYDGDFGTLISPPFSTNLSLCRRIDSTLIKHPIFDSATLTDPTVCHFSEADWTAPYWNLAYTGNSTVSACRLSNGNLNPDLVIPKITRTGGPFVEAALRRVRYQFTIEWCPQDAYIGKYNVNLTATDNGDQWLGGKMDNSISSSALMSLDVVSNVYLLAPRYTTAPATASLRQTAAQAPPFHFVFPLFARNPLGNPLEYTLQNPTTAEGITLNSTTGLLEWKTLSPTLPNLATLTTANPLSMPKVTVQVRDTVTGKIDKVTFNVRVQDPNLSPYEKDPSIKITSPDTANTLFLNEKQIQTFEVQAYDANLSEPNSDSLWAVWYLDDKIVHEEELSTVVGYAYPLSRYRWRPTDLDSSIIGLSNGEKLSIGEHSLRAAVTDGNKWSQTEWRVRVRNTFVLPSLLLSIQDERKLAESAANRLNVNTFRWFSELPFANILTGQTRPTEFLLFAGSFLRNGLTRKYLWRVDMQDGNLQRISNSTTNNWNYYEWLNLGGTGEIQRMAAKPDGTSAGNPVIYGVSVAPKYGPYSGNTLAFFLKGDMTQISQNLPVSYTCPSGSCDDIMFRAPNLGGTYYGKIASASVFTRTFYVDETFQKLYWDINQQLSSRKLIWAVTGSTFINGFAYNKNTNHLFISTSTGLVGGDKVIVFDAAPALTSTTADISVPIYTYTITHPTSPSQVTLPSEMAIASKVGRTDQVFVFLRGSGGVLVIQDPLPPETMGPGSFQFKGMNTIAASQSDALMNGLKIGYDSISDNIIGISREGRQIYTINPDLLDVNISAHMTSLTTPFVSNASIRMDALMIMPLTGSIYFVDRTNSMIFKGN